MEKASKQVVDSVFKAKTEVRQRNFEEPLKSLSEFEKQDEPEEEYKLKKNFVAG